WVSFDGATMQDSTFNIHITPPIASPLPQHATTVSATATRLPQLRAALQACYRQANNLKLPLSEKSFPIKDVNQTISDKSEQDARERKRLQAAQRKAKHNLTDKHLKEPASFWSSRFRLEEECHRIDKPIAIKDLFTVENSMTPTRRILVEGRAG